MRWFAILPLLLLVCAGGVGCGDSAGNVAPMDTFTDVDAPGRGTVQIDGDATLALMYHEAVTITGVYRDSSGDEAATELEVALAGNANDTSVSSTTVHSGTSGAFSFELTAGSVDASFDLRVTAADLAVDEVEVAVTAPADTEASIDATYAGRRQIDLYRIVAMIDESGACDTGAGEVVRSMTTSDATLPAVVDGLPSATALGVSIAGAWCAAGAAVPDECEDWVLGCGGDVELEAGADSLTVDLVDDLSVFEAESYAVHHLLDTSGLAPALVSSVMVPLAEIIDDDADPGLFLLDGIHERISTEMGPTQADLFLGARLSSSLDDAINAAVTADLDADMLALATAFVTALSSIELVGILEGDFWGELDQDALLSLAELIASTASLETSLILAADPAADELRVTYLHDVTTLHEHVLPVGAGEVVTGVLTRVVLPELPGPGTDAEVVTIGEYLAQRVDCASVGSVLAADAGAGSIADADWYASACEHVVENLAGAAMGGAAALDTVYPSMTMQGDCDFLGVDGYPRGDSACSGVDTSLVWGEEIIEGDHGLRLEPVGVD